MEIKNQSNEIDFIEVYRHPHSGGIVLRHTLVSVNADDYNHIYEIAIEKAREYKVIKILPEVHSNDPLREVLFEGAKENKCPDLNIDGEYWEVKTPTLPLKERKISNCIRNSHAQANCVVLILTAKYNENYLRKAAKGRFETHETLERIEFKCCATDNFYSYKRSDF